jgi:hypothetical protein
MNNLLRFVQPQGSEALIVRDSFLSTVQYDEIAAVKAVAYEAVVIRDEPAGRREHRFLTAVQFLALQGLIIEIAEFWQIRF